ncbi:histidine phosphatase family protein [Aeromicrobium sp.]|nr:histidine phosphatase family protein [Candidatus Saccharibacteria bacterium]
MTTFYLCRHGQTENNLHDRLSGWIDTPLTEEGLRNAAQAAAKLRTIAFDKIVSSDLGRSFTPAYLRARHLHYAGEIERYKGLREINYGNVIANMLVADVVEQFPHELVDVDFVPPGGESLCQMQQRVMACLQQIAAANPHSTIILISHDGTMNALYASFAGLDFGAVAATRYNEHNFVARITYDGDKITTFEEITG